MEPTAGSRAGSVAAGLVASSSSISAAVEWKYHVYLSYGGPDTLKGITFELYDRLQRRGIKTFKDDPDIGERDAISPTLKEAIEESMFAIVVLSRDYISCTWCLEELATICECIKDQNRILPLLYHVEPSDVLRSLEEAFSEKRQRWNDLLRKVVSFSRWNTQDYKTDKELVEVIVEFICSKVLPDAIESTNFFEVHQEPRQAVEVMKDLTTESSAFQWKHDVFLSFRGPDTRKGIVSYLFNELQGRGIRTFMDEDGLQAGTEISSNLQTAIKESRSAIVLLSPNYAFSAWCLDELVNIVQGSETRNTIVLPVFYNVEPSHVRHQTGSFEEALIKHGEKRHRDKLNQWKAALKKVADLKGLALKEYGSERQLVEGIVQFVCKTVRYLEIESPGDFIEFEATRKAMVKVMKAFKDDELTAIGLHGMGGVGKTTMAKLVAVEAKSNGLFRHVLMATVSQKPDLRNIQDTLAKQLGVKLEEETISNRADSLNLEIMGRNKILIILDDVWKKIDLSSIGIPSYNKLRDCSSKVLLTTRSSEVCNDMDSQANIALKRLSEDDSWILFEKKTGMSFEKSAVLYNVARSVVEGCAGLPIALVLTARALRNKKLNLWKVAAQRLKSSNESDLVNCIKLSYDYLTSEDAKSLFLLCCLFPEDYDIQIENLLMYGIGKGLFEDCKTLQRARDCCHLEVDYLISSSLLLGTKNDKLVRMHDVIRDVAISFCEGVCVDAGCGAVSWPKINAGTYEVSLMMNEIRYLPENLVCSKLKILLLQHNQLKTIPDSFFQNLIDLNVLDLSNTGISSLPPSVCFLDNLITLNLDSCEEIYDLSILGKLTKLQILSLRECYAKEVPEEIGYLIKLRMLDFTESQIVKVSSRVISRLSALEELYMQCNFGAWGCKVEGAGEDTNSGFDELTDLLLLKTVKVGISDATLLPKSVDFHPKWDYFDICISRDLTVRKSTWKPHLSHDHSKTLTLSTTIHTLPDWFISAVAAKAEKLQYIKCNELQNILVEYKKGRWRLQALKCLVVFGHHENLKELMNTETCFTYEPVFQKLGELHLCEVASLKNLCIGDLPFGSLCNLKLLDVRKCNYLVNALLESPLMERLECLEELFCAHMHGLEYVFGSGKITTCGNLQEMRLCGLPKLRKIWGGPVPHTIVLNLKILAVSGCNKLKTLFTSDIAQCLSQLEDLWVHSCFSLDRIVEESEDTGRSAIFPKLKILVLQGLPWLRSLYSNSRGGSPSSVIKFPSLEYFQKIECPKLLPSAINFHSQKQVRQNDLRLYRILKERLWENMELEFTIWQYDVFLSFHGDTRMGIISKLYDQLQRRRIKTFMDDSDFKVKDVIYPTLLTAIEESRLSIVVLSPNYVSSACCLEELAKICECMEESSRIFPLFYNVEPSNVSSTEAFKLLIRSGRHTPDQVQRWKDTLNKVASWSGWDAQDYMTEIEVTELIEVIVEHLTSKVLPDASIGDFQSFKATEQAMYEVMMALLDDEVTVVGVWGMGGVGKTTLVIHVAAHARQNGVFDYVIMVVVSQLPEVTKIQRYLADQLGFRLDEETEIGRAVRLKREIMRREKILIIFDDVWERINLPSIGIPSYEELQKCNSKVLLTTRRSHVCHAVKCQKTITLSLLSEQDSWALFLRNARRSFESPAFESVAKKVARECSGLPIALITVARALADKDQAEWEKAARRLEKSRSAIVGDGQEAFECIKFSFDYLKDEDSKSCLLLCCLFPEDHEIGIEDLLRYAVRTGFFQDAETIKEARGTLVSVVKYLKDSSLLSDSQTNGCVKMHDVIRDTAIQIAESEHGFRVKVGFGLKDWPRGLGGGCSTISLMRNEIRKLPEEELVCPHLQILLLNRNANLYEIPEKFVKSLSELRVLDVSNTGISVLPQSFSLLTNLQALYLDDCRKLMDISVVGKLKKLEILSMRNCPPMELPREIGHLTNLRILDVNRFKIGGMVTIPSKVISKLHKLEELYMVYCQFEDWGCEVEGRGEVTSIGFDELVGLSYLKILQIGIPDVEYIPTNVVAKPDWDYFCISIMGRCRYDLGSSKATEASPTYTLGDHSSRSLSLNGPTISILPDWFTKVITEKIEKLEYQCCGGIRDILMEYDLGRLHELKYLRLCGSSLGGYGYLMKELMNTTGRVQKGPVFEKLEELHLLELFWLEELCVGELPLGSLFNLKVLNISFCHKLKNVSKFIQRLPSLEKLQLNGMFKLEYVFGCEGSELKQSKLREVHLVGRNSVKSICSDPAPRVMFQSIKILVIYKCELLQSLFALEVAQCLSQLEDLYVEDCPLLERVIEVVNNEKTALQKLKKLGLRNLPELYGASCTVDIVCPSLEHLIVVDCPNIPFSTSSFDLFNALESRNWFSSSAFDYFGSTNPVQLNDPIEFMCDRGTEISFRNLRGII